MRNFSQHSSLLFVSHTHVHTTYLSLNVAVFIMVYSVTGAVSEAPHSTVNASGCQGWHGASKPLGLQTPPFFTTGFQ